MIKNNVFNMINSITAIWDMIRSLQRFNPIPTRLFLCSKNQGGGAHCAPPPSKNPVTLLRTHQSDVFLKACPKNESFGTTLVSMETMVSVLRWFIVS